jgi:predicted DCC family thiol-disulfide oxidoreductase YuxK
VLERNDKNKRIRFVDISDIDYDPMANMGVVRLAGGPGRWGREHAAGWLTFPGPRAPGRLLAACGRCAGSQPQLTAPLHPPPPTPHLPPHPHPPQEFEDAMDTIHAIRPDGRVLQGTDALRALFDEVGLGWVVTLMELPLFTKIVDLIYDFLSKNRIKISGAFDALVAAKRVSMAKVRFAAGAGPAVFSRRRRRGERGAFGGARAAAARWSFPLRGWVRAAPLACPTPPPPPPHLPIAPRQAGVEVCGDVDGGCEIEWGDLSTDEGDAVSHV